MPEPLSEGDSGEARLEEGVASLEYMFQMNHEVAPEPTSLASQFGTSQLKDPSLASALQQVTMVDGKPIEGVSHITNPPFFYKDK
jgi:hypothetical protein